MSIDFPFGSVIIKGEKRTKPEGRQSETSLEWETDAERWGAGERLSQKLTGKKKGCWTGPWKDHDCGANEAITNWQKDRGIHACGFPCLFLYLNLRIVLMFRRAP